MRREDVRDLWLGAPGARALEPPLLRRALSPASPRASDTSAGRPELAPVVPISDTAGLAEAVARATERDRLIGYVAVEAGRELARGRVAARTPLPGPLGSDPPTADRRARGQVVDDATRSARSTSSATGESAVRGSSLSPEASPDAVAELPLGAGSAESADAPAGEGDEAPRAPRLVVATLRSEAR